MTFDTGQTVRIIPVLISTGAFTVVLGTRLSRRVEITEDGSGGATALGLIYQLPIFNSDDPRVWTWGPTLQLLPGQEPLVLGDVAVGLFGPPTVVANGPGNVLGYGPTPATPIINVKSAGAATAIRVTEYS